MADTIEELEAKAEKLREDKLAARQKTQLAQNQASEELRKKQLQAEVAQLEREKARAQRLATKRAALEGAADVVATVVDDKKEAEAGLKADAKARES